MKLPKLGPPNEIVIVGANRVRVRDELGLPLDPLCYADPKCKQCYGRGVITTVHNLTPAQLAKLAQDDPAARQQVTQENGQHIFRSMASCSCARPRYERARQECARAAVSRP